MIKVGIIGGAGYTAGELIRLLINHPEVEIKFINSSSNAGNKITDVHEGLYGETDLVFTDELPLDEIDVLFFCTAHGDTKKFMESHNVPEDLKIIDLSMDYRIKSDDHDFVYGLPELNRRTNEGLSKAGGIADEAAASLQAADENTRNNLISMATGGTDATEAAKLAASGLSQNLNNSLADRSVATVGSLFNDLTNAYLSQNLSKYAQQIANNYGSRLNSAQDKTDTHKQYQGS